MKTILSISSQVAGALVGNGVAAFAMERLGVRVLEIPTVLFGRRPDRGPPGGGPVDASLMRDMLAALRDDGKLAADAVLSGYLARTEQIDVVLDAVDMTKSANAGAFYLCDPIMGDEDGPYVKEEVAAAIVGKLIRHADWIAPNIWEMARIAGDPCTDVETTRRAARRLGKPALISGIPTPAGLGVLYCDVAGDWLAETPRLARAPKGTGDLLTALFLARRVLGEDAQTALEAAAGSVHDVILLSAAERSDELALPNGQDFLVNPQTRPDVKFLGAVI